MKNKFAIIEIGSNNTKTHVYENKKIRKESNVTIEFKKNYGIAKRIDENDIKKLYSEIEKVKKDTNNIYIFGCSIFRNLSKVELDKINQDLQDKFQLMITVVSQEEEAQLTAYGCYSNIDYKGNICIFIGGGGSTELIIVNNKKIIEKKYLDFGVVDITNQFSSLKNDIPDCRFEEVYSYIDSLIDDFKTKCELLILAGGDHLYWYHNAKYALQKNDLYQNKKQEYMLTIQDSDRYDRDALLTSLDKIRENSDNPLWFDGSRAMKVLTNVISHKVGAKYIVPTKINMEDGLAKKIMENK